MNFLRNSSIQFQRALPIFRDNNKLQAFTDFYLKKTAEEKNMKVSQGRAWDANELRIKSSEDLHKLWYLLLKEKNAILSDNKLKKKIHGTQGPQGRMRKVRQTMAKIQTIISERKKICQEYRKSLEEEYIQKQRELYEQKILEEEKQKEFEPKVPEITFNLMRAKYHDLKRGIDNTEYIKKAVEIETNKTQLKQYLDEKYDYKTKKIVKNPEESDLTDSNVLLGFKSGIIEQLNSGRYKISQEEVLRSHVRNWKMLDLKQKRKVLGVLNARRARDARSEFMKEINLLGQKIAYDKLQEERAQGTA